MESNPDRQAVVVLITVPTLEVGRQIAKALLEKKLAACINILSPINSLYTWQGQVQEDEEVLLIVKSRVDLFHEELVSAVKAIHPYEVPEIIALPVLEGLRSYLDWINEATDADLH